MDSTKLQILYKKKKEQVEQNKETTEIIKLNNSCNINNTLKTSCFIYIFLNILYKNQGPLTPVTVMKDSCHQGKVYKPEKELFLCD